MKRYPMLFFPTIVLTVLVFGSAPALAERQTIGSFQDWTAFVDGTGPSRICYIGSVPKKAEGKYSRRGDTYVLATHRPSEKVEGEISVEAGYTYKDGSDAIVDIDGKVFKLFTKGGNAWADDANNDRELVAAMKAGHRMVIKGTSSRGTLTTDTYSLSGFTAAYNAISEACGP